MLKTFILFILLLIIAALLFSVGVFLKKKGGMVNPHVGKNPHLKKRGIGCARSQDREAQRKGRST